MYKLGMIDLDTMQAVLSEKEFSGGVLKPVRSGEEVYYIATFVSRNSLMRFPESAASISGKRINLRLTKLDAQNYTTVSEPPYTGPTKPYIGLKYMNPFNLWLPLPLLRSSSDGSSIRLDGGGIFSVMTDPLDRNTVFLLAYADVPYKMAMVDQFTWQNTYMGFPLSLNFSDKITESGDKIYRHTSASLSGTVRWTGEHLSNQFLLGGGYIRNAGYEKDKSAYEWKETRNAVFMQAGYAFLYRRITFQISGASLTDNFEPHVDMIIRANTKTRFPLSFTFFGAYDKGGMDLHGASSTFGSTSVEKVAMKEYPHPSGLELFWLGGGEISVGIFSFEIQKNLSHLYFNRFFGSLSSRNQIYDAKGNPNAEGIEAGNLHLIQSLGLKLGIKTSILPAIKIPFTIEPYVFGAWRVSDTINGKRNPWYIDAGVTAAF